MEEKHGFKEQKCRGSWASLRSPRVVTSPGMNKGHRTRRRQSTKLPEAVGGGKARPRSSVLWKVGLAEPRHSWSPQRVTQWRSLRITSPLEGSDWSAEANSSTLVFVIGLTIRAHHSKDRSGDSGPYDSPVPAEAETSYWYTNNQKIMILLTSRARVLSQWWRPRYCLLLKVEPT